MDSPPAPVAGQASTPVPPVIFWLLWAALLGAVLIYLVIVQVVGGEPQPEGDWRLLRGPLLVLTGVLVLGSFALRALVTKRFSKHADQKWRSVAFVTYVMSLALGEAVAVFGLVLAFQGAPFQSYIPFFIAAFLTVVLQPPTFLRQL